MRQTLLALALFAAGCASQMTSRDAAIDSLMRDYSGDVPGAEVAVVRDGSIVFAKAYGMANLETGEAMTTSHDLRLASMTKEFTATAIEILDDDGKLTLDDPITRWLPSLPAYAQAITIRHLLTHTSGLIDYEDLIPKDQKEQISDADVLHYLETTDHTLFAPGSRYRYSNSGYVLLGLIVERVSHVGLGAFFHREIFDPAGMTGSVVMESGAAIPRRAYGFSTESGRWIPHDQSVTSATRGDGAVYSSVLDLAKWEVALREAKVVSPASLRQAFAPAIPTDTAGVSYGFGWFIGTHAGHHAIWHTGETSGFTNAILRIPDAGVMVVVLTNRAGGDPLKVARDIADLELSRR